MMEMVHMEEASDEGRSLRLDRMCLRAVMSNYSTAESEPDSVYSEQDLDTNSTLRSWARDLWVIGSNVLFRSDPNQHSIQILQLLSQYGSGWISINPWEISAQGSLQKSLSLLESHGLIRVDFNRQRIRIEGINLTKEIQEKSQFDGPCRCELKMISEFLPLLNTLDLDISRPRHIGLTCTLRLVLSHPEFKLTQGFVPFFDKWVRGLLDHLHEGLEELNEAQRQVMTAGIDIYEDIRSLPFKSLEIHFLLRTVLRSRSDSEGARAKDEDDLGLLMSKAMTYINLVQTAVAMVTVDKIRGPNLKGKPYFIKVVIYPSNLQEHTLYEILKDCVDVVRQLRKLILTLTSALTPHLIGILEQLTSFFMSGWNSWKHLKRANEPYEYGGKFGSVFFAGLLDCLKKQGKPEEILTLVKGTKENLNKLRWDDRFEAFFPARVMAHALSLAQESAHEKEILFLELESYLMGNFRAHNKPRRGNHVRGYWNGKVLPHLFDCLAQLGRYETLQGIIAELGSHLQTLNTDISIFEPYVHLPSALAASVKDMDFPTKEALLEETFRLAQTLVTKTWDFVTYESTRKLRHDPMGELITFCFVTGMVHELTEFFGKLEVFLMNKYGEDRLGPITTTFLYFGDRVTDGLERVGPVKMTNCDWSEFLEQVKRSVVKWIQLISTPPHVHERKSWMDGIAVLICRNCDSYLEEKSSRKSIVES